MSAGKLSELLKIYHPKQRRRLRASPCRLCGYQGSLTAHHLVPKRLGGQDVHDNLIALCWRCHKRVDGNDLHVREDARRSLRASLTLDEIRYVRGRMRGDWLDRHYPLAGRDSATLTEDAK